MKVAYNILHKLGTKQEPMVRPGDRVSAVKLLHLQIIGPEQQRHLLSEVPGFVSPNANGPKSGFVTLTEN